MNIELIAFSACPTLPLLRDSLRGALDHLASTAQFHEVDPGALADDDPRRCWACPTVLVDGLDLFDSAPASCAPLEGCRIYAHGLPDAGELIERLREKVGMGRCPD